MNNLLSWFMFGLTVGVLGVLLDKKNRKGGALGTIFLGVLGALLGGLLANVVLGGDITSFNFFALVVALSGSLILLTIQSSVKRISN